MLQAILFQEIRFYGIEDPIADGIVISTYFYLQGIEDFNNGVVFIPPEKPALFRKDCSTGIAQVFAATAIKAVNEKSPNMDNQYDWHDLRTVWKKLQDDEYCINIAAVYLSLLQHDLQNRKLTMAKYNGSGELAEKYGEATEKYYIAFQKYNEEAQKRECDHERDN